MARYCFRRPKIGRQLDDAEEEKVRVEEAQRRRRREGKDVTPRWFKKMGPGDTDWVYGGEYWKARQEGWSADQPRLW